MCDIFYVHCMLSVIACVLPSITGLFFSRFLYSPLSQTCSLFCREKRLKTFFQNHSDKCFCFVFFELNECILNKLSRESLRGGLKGEEETSYLPSRKTIKADSTELSKNVTQPKHRGPTLGKNERHCTENTKHNILCRLRFTFIFCHTTSTKL